MTTDVTLNGSALSAAVPAAKVLEVRRQLVGRRRHRRASVPGRAGAWTFGEQPGDRTLVVVVDIEADSFADRRAAVVALANWCDLLEPSALIVDDQADRYHEALLDAVVDTDEWLRRSELELPFITGPYALASALSTESIAASGSPDSGTFPITDKVTAEPIIELTPTDGTLTGFALTVNGYELSWTPAAGSLASGETVTVSSISDTVTLGANDDVNLTGTFDVADVDMQDVAGEFPLLFEGSNAWALAWTGTATAVTLDLTWRERYR